MSTATLGTVLLLLGAGALLGMQACGPLADRFGSGTVAVVAGAVMAVTVMLPLAANTTLQAAVAAFVYGVATGSADVSMNAAAVDLERERGRPIMASFHGLFSVGNIVGSLFGAAGFAWGLAPKTAVASISVVCVLIVTASAVILRPRLRRGVARTPEPPMSDPAIHAGRRSVRILMLGALAFLLLLSEGSAMDWSSFHAQHHLGASAMWGAITLGVFVTAMTSGRFTVDRIAARVGGRRVLRWGSVVAAVGCTVVLVAPTLPVALAGWFLFGVGLSGGLPQVFTAAGVLEHTAGRVLARVVGLGYVAILAGPALVGWVAEFSSLNTAFLLPLCAVLICAASARFVTTSPVVTSELR